MARWLMLEVMQEADLGPTTTDVVLELTETTNGMQGRLICSTDVFSRASGERLAASIQVSSNCAMVQGGAMMCLAHAAQKHQQQSLPFVSLCTSNHC